MAISAFLYWTAVS